MTIPDEQFRSRFEIRRELGRGGMGEVYLAHDAYLQREVAIKFAKLKLFEDPEVGVRAKKMWLNETRLAGRLRHPHIVEIHEAGVTGEFGYLAMEYVPGVTLRQHARADRLLPPDTVIEILYKVCNALDYANKMGLLHRDIKPANIMMTAQGEVKVTDFGTCYLTDADETQVFDVGTLPFMPPEHFKKRPPTMQSDIYAVGVMAYQLLTGALPFRANSFQEMIHEKLHEEFVPVEIRRMDIAKELRFAVHRAIHPDPEVRYASWRNFCDDLALALPRLERPGEVLFDTARFESLRRLPFFFSFGDAQLWETIHISRWHNVAEGRIVFEEGSASDSVYVLAKGDVVVTSAGRTLNRLGPGECFGEIAYLDEERHARTATVTARTPLVLIEIDAAALRLASAELRAAFDQAFVRLLVGRIKKADRRYLDAMDHS